MIPSPQEKETRLNHLRSVRALSDEDLQYAYAWGWTDPNLDMYDPIVKAILEERLLMRIGDLTQRQTFAIGNVETAISKLTSSSEELERLTIRLNYLTIVLVILTVIAVLTPFGVEAWHIYHPEPGPVLFKLPQPTTSTLPEAR